MAPSTADKDAVRETVRTVFADYPVTVGFLFGSLARSDATDASDIDVAVAFTDQPSVATDHTEQRLALSTDLALELGTDAVDVVDLRAAPPALVRSIFDDGTQLVGTKQDASRLRDQLLTDADATQRSPAERFDDALAALDDHLA
ncbi:type VII toxin-antitoxin system MntA family adenylyltransferase antitoxin [Halonotius terrestris]|nr:nucleotidyltransferase domain-containing protein [Halonotius terrestris]